MKKSLSLLLLLTMLLSSFPLVVSAGEEVVITTSDSRCELIGQRWKESTNPVAAGPLDGTSWYTTDRDSSAVFDASNLRKGSYGVYVYMTPYGVTADKIDVEIISSGIKTAFVIDGMHGGLGNRHWIFVGKYKFDGSNGDGVSTWINANASEGCMRASAVKFVKDDTNSGFAEILSGVDVSKKPEITEFIITTDDSLFVKTGKWTESTNSVVEGPLGGTSWYTSDREATGFYDASNLEAGNYGVYLYVTHYGTTADRVDVTITASGKETTYITDGTFSSSGNRTWIFLGKYDFDGSLGDGVLQKINETSTNGYMRASGVKFVKDDENSDAPNIIVVEDEFDENGFITVPEKGSVVLSGNHPSFTKEGSWVLSSLQVPARGNAYYALEKGATATWSPKINKIDDVEIFYFKAGTENDDPALEIEVYAEGTVKKLNVNCATVPPEWVSLGKYNFSGNGDEYIKITSVTNGTYSRATCLKFAKNDNTTKTIDTNSAFYGTDLHILERMGMLIGEGDGITEEYIKTVPTRVQAAIMVLRLNGVDAEAAEFTGTDNFADANLEPWAMPYLAYLKAHPEFGLVGTGDNMFEPGEKIDEQAYAKILLTALGYEYNVDFTWDETLSFAKEKGIARQTSGAFTVKDLAVMTSLALDLKNKDGSSYFEKLILNRDGVKDEGVYGTVLPEDLKAQREALKKSKKGILYNNDGNDVYKEYDNYPGAFDISGLDGKTINTENFLKTRSYGLQDTQVSLVTYCTGVFNSYTHESSGITDTRVRDWSRALKEYTGKDSLETMIDYVHSTGREILWSMRMNDSHDSAYDESELDPWKQANMNLLMARKDERFMLLYSGGGWSTVDYTLTPVRQVVYDILKDTLTRYDIDGLELDFTRATLFFKEITQGYNAYPENIERMNNLIRMVRDLTEKISIERGKPILLAIYVPNSIDFCKVHGLDVETWLKEDLIDVVSVGSSIGMFQTWEDSIAEYKNKYDVQVFAALDPLLYPEGKDGFIIDKNEAAIAYAAGADGICTYNYFDINHQRFDVLGSPETVGPVDPNYKSELKLYNGSSAKDTKKFVTLK